MIDNWNPTQRNNNTDYPIGEPVFPYYNNMGRDATINYENEKDSIDEKGLSESENYSEKQKARKKVLSRINLDWGRWKYMEVRYATQVDNDSRTCAWCLEAHPNSDRSSGFRKGDIIIREQFSNQDFKTLHMDCAVEKIEAIARDIQVGKEKLSQFIRIVSP